MTDPVMHQLRRQINRTASVGQAPPVRGGLIVLAVIAGFALGLLVLSIGPKFVSAWRESRLLRQTETNFKKGNFNSASDAARQDIHSDRDYLAAHHIQTETADKQK